MPYKTATKVSTQLLIDPGVRDRARIVAVVSGLSVAEVLRRSVEGKGLASVEREYLDGVTAFREKYPDGTAEHAARVLAERVRRD